MSGTISLDGEDTFFGTQMKPDIFEPATAEWGGRLARDAGWLFARQQRVIFSEGVHRAYFCQTPDLSFEQLFRRRFWLNEVFGTFLVRFYLSSFSENAFVSGTLIEGYDNSWNQIGTCDGTYTGGGWKNLYIYTDPDWHKTGLGMKHYGQLLLRGIREEPFPSVRFSYLSLEGFPRT